jgi:uncharacterized protein YdaU (DUF1376 family)
MHLNSDGQEIPMSDKKKKKPKMSAKLNGQEYVPPYQFWCEREFWGDVHVSRGMSWMQRHLYRALLQAAFYSSTRPYLPTSDDDLWILADAGTKKHWLENKNAIMLKFQLIKVKGVELWSHKRIMRDWIKLLEYSQKQSNRRKKNDYENNEAPAEPEAVPFEEDDVVEADESAV